MVEIKAAVEELSRTGGGMAATVERLRGLEEALAALDLS